MKKTLAIIMTLIAATAPVTTFAAAPATAAKAAPAAAQAVTATTEKAAALKKAGVNPNEKDPNKVIVIVNGVEMTQAEARVVILQNIKNHRQMTPEEMAAYVNNLEANAKNK